MANLQRIDYSGTVARKELDALDVMLQTDGPLSEQDDLLPFFREHQHVAASLGLFFPEISIPDRIGFEYGILGQFRADIVIGNLADEAFVFIELEDASRTSIFQNKGRHVSHWSPRFHRGFGQLTDWFYAMDQLANDRIHEDTLGCPDPLLFPMLIIGRRSHLSAAEQKRLRWHRRKVLIDSAPVFAHTFDDVAAKLRRKL